MKLVYRDCGDDYIEVLAVGIEILEGGGVLVSGLQIPDELKWGRTWISFPLIPFMFPKNQPTDMPLEQWKEQTATEYHDKYRAAFTEACKRGGTIYGKKPQDLDKKSTVRNETTYGVWAYIVDQEPQSNNQAVEELSSGLDKLCCRLDEGTGSFDEFKADNIEK
ncbi:hypothetical protein C2S53_002971 [Perilla frutescens var. hirtella]|uniref:Uncharacterized protein n=1 Tax=Perilla frutescens var. hirtella TaxID=608512 RepID=A0AAD4JG18_PERFH|nr:hypothetical protein C2S53_002971 [Perilla frutescens var. hirtella]